MASLAGFWKVNVFCDEHNMMVQPQPLGLGNWHQQCCGMCCVRWSMSYSFFIFFVYFYFSGLHKLRIITYMLAIITNSLIGVVFMVSGCAYFMLLWSTLFCVLVLSFSIVWFRCTSLFYVHESLLYLILFEKYIDDRLFIIVCINIFVLKVIICFSVANNLSPLTFYLGTKLFRLKKLKINLFSALHKKIYIFYWYHLYSIFKIWLV